MAKRERAAPVVHDDGFTINGCAFHVDAKYKPLDAIGQGSYGVVCSVRNTATDEKLAIKKITPMAGDEWDATHTLREIRLMRCLGAHENIISLKDLSMCQEKDELYMMMELADTDLHRLIQSSCPLTEGHIRITDFGLARMMPKEHQSNDDGSGDSLASAPTAVVIPIPDKDRRGYFIEKDALKFLSSLPPAPPSALEKLARSAGPHASDLIQRLLCFNPRERVSVDAALAHPFFDGVRDEWGEIAPLALGHSLEFAFENQSLPLAALRQYICDEVLAFRAKDDAALHATAQAPDPTDDAGSRSGEKQERAPEQRHSASGSNNSSSLSLKLENDWKPGSGFTIKGCEFNVPPQYKALQVLGEGSYGITNVAIKKITPMAGDEWDAKHTLREIRLMRYFGQHPNRGYAVEGDALKFLESLPPCSPSAMTKTFRKASAEAVSLLRRLLCVNPERRITAKQALAHPYFKGIRQQLGEPPEFQVAKAFDFDFDSHELPLSRLKQLIQDEVKLLQQDQRDPSAASSAPIVSTKPVGAAASGGAESEVATQQQEHSDSVGPDSRRPDASPSKREDASPAAQSGANSLSDDEHDDFERAMLREPRDAKTSSSAAPAAAVGPPIAPKEFLATQNASPSSGGDSEAPAEETRRKGRDELPETDDGDSESDCGKLEHQLRELSKQQQPSVDSDDEPHEIIQVERGPRGPGAKATASGASKLERPKSAVGSHRAATARPDSRDEDQQHQRHRQSSARPSGSSGGNNSHDAERWGQPRASTTQSRIHHPVYGATIAREGTSEKSDAMRHPERVVTSATASSARSLHAMKTTPTTSKTTPITSRTSVALKPSSSSSTKEAALPDGWIKKTHSKSGREYYYDTLHKVSSWKHPAKMLENIFGAARVSAASSSSNNNSTSGSSKVATPTSADSTTPTSSKIVTAGRRTSLSGTSASSAAALPKDWARRTDPKSGRLFYVNLLTNKSFAKLPSSVAAAMGTSKDKEPTGGVASSSSSSNLAATAAGATKRSSGDLLRKKSTIPQSPQFSQMSWQRKRAPGTDDTGNTDSLSLKDALLNITPDSSPPTSLTPPLLLFAKSPLLSASSIVSVYLRRTASSMSDSRSGGGRPEYNLQPPDSNWANIGHKLSSGNTMPRLNRANTCAGHLVCSHWKIANRSPSPRGN
ncbi:hypothetical protein PybrP1_007955, partial [[Pythium] brassicae (nom. inval.)]